MKVTYDDEAQAIYIYLRPENEKGIVTDTINIDHGINLDIGYHDKPIGLEIILSDPNTEGTSILLKHFDIIRNSK